MNAAVVITGFLSHLPPRWSTFLLRDPPPHLTSILLHPPPPPPVCFSLPCARGTPLKISLPKPRPPPPTTAVVLCLDVEQFTRTRLYSSCFETMTKSRRERERATTKRRRMKKRRQINIVNDIVKKKE